MTTLLVAVACYIVGFVVGYVIASVCSERKQRGMNVYELRAKASRSRAQSLRLSAEAKRADAEVLKMEGFGARAHEAIVSAKVEEKEAEREDESAMRWKRIAFEESV